MSFCWVMENVVLNRLQRKNKTNKGDLYACGIQRHWCAVYPSLVGMCHYLACIIFKDEWFLREGWDLTLQFVEWFCNHSFGGVYCWVTIELIYSILMRWGLFDDDEIENPEKFYTSRSWNHLIKKMATIWIWVQWCELRMMQKYISKGGELKMI